MSKPVPCRSLVPLVLLVLSTPALAAGPPADAGFALRLFRHSARGPGNAFLSPYSVASALAMAAEGARGETARQMSAALGGPPDSVARALEPVARRVAAAGKPYELSAANALWVARSFTLRPAYVGAVASRWDAGVFDVDFRGAPEAARGRINRWVEERTHDRIKDLLAAGTLGPATRLVLTNAVYFKGGWLAPFQKERTRPAPFTRADGSKVDAPLMHLTAPKAYAALEGVKLLEMPYEGGELSMVVVLPDRADGLAVVERGLDGRRLARWVGAMSQREVAVTFPRFRVESAYELKPALSALGMPAAFDPARADFGGIAELAGGQRLFVSAVVHKAFVEVTEEGTEAAAATGAMMKVTSARREPVAPVEFRADHPFLFLIRENASGAILFVGRVADPTAS